MTGQRSEQELRRREELETIRSQGIDPYPYEWEVDTHAAEILDSFDDEAHDPDEASSRWEVSVAGRMMAKRVMGGASFFDIQDESDRIQVYVREDDVGEDQYYDLFEQNTDIGDIFGVEGFVFRTGRGEITIHATKIRLLAKALRPLPVVKEAEGELHDAVTDKDFRYRRRYVDLTVHPPVQDVFRKRSDMIQSLRRQLDERGYMEVETPVLQPVYGGATAEPFTTHHNALDMDLYLRIADELYLKRLLVGGFEGVYEIGKNFRNEGLSRFHNPEFTMLELYVAYKDYKWMMDEVERLIEQVAVDVHGSPEVPHGDETLSFERPWARIGFFDAIEEYTGEELLGVETAKLREVADELDVDDVDELSRGKLYDAIFGAAVEPHLVDPTFVVDYPIELSPLAKKHREKEGLVERFEVICNGNEICNAFSELNDPDDQRERFEEQAQLRAAGDEEAMQIDEDFLRALEYGMPPSAGLGVGIDRLAMLLTDQDSIRDVILFPLMRPEHRSEANAAGRDEAERDSA